MKRRNEFQRVDSQRCRRAPARSLLGSVTTTGATSRAGSTAALATGAVAVADDGKTVYAMIAGDLHFLPGRK